MEWIRIKAVPPGKEPREIREKLVGAIFPITGPIYATKDRRLKGFIVKQSIFLTFLGDHNKAACDWYIKNIFGYAAPNDRPEPGTEFPLNVCEEIEPVCWKDAEIIWQRTAKDIAPIKVRKT